MSRNSSKSKRILTAVAFPLIGLSALPLYRFSRPWIDFHQKNFVIYDCRIHSPVLPVGSKQEGLIQEIFVKTGDTIQAGQPIAQLDTSDLDAEERRWQGRLELARIRLDSERKRIQSSVDAALSRETWQSAQVEVARQRAKAIQAELKWVNKEVDRRKKLAERGSVSVSELDHQLRQLQTYHSNGKVAELECSAAVRRLAFLEKSTLQVKTDGEKTRELRQEIELARAELDGIRKRRQSFTIRSRSSGVVTEIVRGPGSSIRIGEPILHLQGGEVWAEAWVEESNLAKVITGDTAWVTLKAYPGEKYPGRVSAVLPHPTSVRRQTQKSENPVLQQDSRICLLIRFQTEHPQLIPGLTGRASVSRQSGKDRQVQLATAADR